MRATGCSSPSCSSAKAGRSIACWRRTCRRPKRKSGCWLVPEFCFLVVPLRPPRRARGLPPDTSHQPACAVFKRVWLDPSFGGGCQSALLLFLRKDFDVDRAVTIIVGENGAGPIDAARRDYGDGRL